MKVPNGHTQKKRDAMHLSFFFACPEQGSNLHRLFVH